MAGAQAPSWVLATSSPTSVVGDATVLSTATDDQGNVFVTGYFDGQAAFGSTTLTSAGHSDVFVAKYQPATGTWAWAQGGGGTGYDMGQHVAVSGNCVYVTGNIDNTSANSNQVRFGGTSPTTSTATVNGAARYGAADILVAKYTDNGTSATLGWTQVGGGTGNDGGEGIAVSGTSVYVTGIIEDNGAGNSSVVFGGNGTTPGTVRQFGVGSQDLVVLKYTDQGTSAALNWIQVGGGTDADKGLSIAVNGTSVYVAGVIANDLSNSRQVVFGGTGTTPGTVPQAGASRVRSSDWVLAKYTDNGTSATLGWTQVAGGTGDDFDYYGSLAVNGSSVYLAGQMPNNSANANQVVFGGTGTTRGPATQPGASSQVSYDWMVAKYTDNGATATLGWTQVAGGTGNEGASALVASGSSLYVVGGTTNDQANSQAVVFGGSGPSAGTVAWPGVGTAAASHLTIARYTDHGSSATLDWLQRGSTGPDGGYGMALSGNTLYIVGYASLGATFSGLPFGTPTPAYPLASASFLGALQVSPAADPEGLFLFPNPAYGEVRVSGAAPNVPVRTYDAVGHLVATTTTNALGRATLPGNLVAGLYLVRIDSHTLRLVMLR